MPTTGQIANPEIFLFNRGTSLFTQATSTTTTNNLFPVFNSNPNIAGSGGSFTLAFSSNANLATDNNDGGGNGNSEVFVATYNGAAIVGGSTRQITKTRDTSQGAAVLFSLGRRLSRDGRWVVFETRADSPTANASTNNNFLTSFVCDLASNPTACSQVAPRPLTTADVQYQFPGFTDYTGTSPGTVVFSSALNFKSDGTLLAPLDNTGLNPASVAQLFAVSLPVPAQPTGPYTRLTDIQGTNVLAPLNSMPSNSRRRVAFTYGGAELGGGNAGGSGEVFYHLVPTATTQSSAPSSHNGREFFSVASPSPTGTPAAVLHLPNPAHRSPATGPWRRDWRRRVGPDHFECEPRAICGCYGERIRNDFRAGPTH